MLLLPCASNNDIPPPLFFSIFVLQAVSFGLVVARLESRGDGHIYIYMCVCVWRQEGKEGR